MHTSFFSELRLMHKTAEELSEAARGDLPKKDFAVPAAKSNTGERAYPIPDKQHARSALGFAKMHGDSADYARVRAKVEAKFPDMLKKSSKIEQAKSFGKNVLRHLGHAAGGAIDTVQGPTNTAVNGITLGDSRMAASGVGGLAALGAVHHMGRRQGRKDVEKEKDSMMPGTMGTGALPGMVGGPPGSMPATMKMGSATSIPFDLTKKAPGLGERVIGAVANRFSHPLDLAGLGVLALPAADQLQAHTRAAVAGPYNKEEVKKRELLPHVAHPLAELGGLGLIAAPVAAQVMKGQHG